MPKRCRHLHFLPVSPGCAYLPAPECRTIDDINPVYPGKTHRPVHESDLQAPYSTSTKSHPRPAINTPCSCSTTSQGPIAGQSDQPPQLSTAPTSLHVFDGICGGVEFRLRKGRRWNSLGYYRLVFFLSPSRLQCLPLDCGSRYKKWELINHETNISNRLVGKGGHSPRIVGVPARPGFLR